MQWNDKALGLVTVLYLVLFLMHLLYFATRKEGFTRLIWAALYATFGLHTLALVLRWIESYQLSSGHAPLTNFYESLIFFAWCIALLLILMRRHLLRLPLLTMFASVTALAFMGYASLSGSVDSSIKPLIPALQSNWLHIHVFTCFIAYAAFTLSFFSGLLSLFAGPSRVQWKETLDEVNHRSVVVGFPMLTAGIMTGAVWAHYAWGSYWTWDPKETWSLITWIVYALFLHARFVRGWQGRRMAVISVIGFISVLFTYFGVNFILSGLHSYAT